MSSELRLRPARKSDAAALAALVDIAGEGMPAFVWSQMKAPGQSLLEFGRSRAARDTGAFSYRNATVADINGEVAACLVDYRLDNPYQIGDVDEYPKVVRPLVRLEAKAPGTWYVNVLAAFPEFRNQGLGARLLAEAERHTRSAGAGMLSIIVASENASAMRLYRRIGFDPAAREPVSDFPGSAHGGDWVLMLKHC